ncbi:hypothetical protein L6307_01340 [Candidatus Parcubacteria bacterium]|nr:hypothetical protein [Candidatus Parcubacteria bacterium]
MNKIDRFLKNQFISLGESQDAFELKIGSLFYLLLLISGLADLFINCRIKGIVPFIITAIFIAIAFRTFKAHHGYYPFQIKK